LYAIVTCFHCHVNHAECKCLSIRNRVTVPAFR
jgi:hypothetical protein